MKNINKLAIIMALCSGICVQAEWKSFAKPAVAAFCAIGLASWCFGGKKKAVKTEDKDVLGAQGHSVQDILNNISITQGPVKSVSLGEVDALNGQAVSALVDNDLASNKKKELTQQERVLQKVLLSSINLRKKNRKLEEENNHLREDKRYLQELLNRSNKLIESYQKAIVVVKFFGKETWQKVNWCADAIWPY